MTTLREAAQMALEAMDHLHRTGDTQVFDRCYRENTEALRAALAQQDEWQGLTDEEIMEVSGYDKQYGYIPKYARNFIAAIEAKLKEKNT